MTNRIIFFIFSLTLSSATISASYKTCNGRKQTWLKDNTTLYLSPVSFPEGSIFTKQTHDMIQQWNNVTGSNFKFHIGVDNDNYAEYGNKKNEVYFYPLGKDSTTLGVTHRSMKCGWFFGNIWGYQETDIEINSDKNWTSSSYTGVVSNNLTNFKPVMLHELGHALGLGHSDHQLAVMNTYYPSGGSVGYYEETTPLPDDRWGLKILYPDNSSGRDVAVSRFKGDGEGHLRYNQLNKAWMDRKTGDTISVEYTILNLGTTDESVTIQFYISTNDYISTYDTYLGSTTWTMPGYSQANASKTITIPNLSNGQYYLGFIVDPMNNIPETNENNNQVSIMSKVEISN